MPTISAKSLRDPAQLAQVPDDRPGWYRWWAPEPVLRKLLGSHYQELAPLLTRGQGGTSGLFCIYVGVAIRGSIRARLKWHINQKHTFSAVKHGALSTLRQSIASLVGSSQGDEAATNQLIDLLTVEYYPVDWPIKSDQVKTTIETTERAEMQNHVLPLNIRGNRNPAVASYKKYLKAARKNAKASYLIQQ